MEPMVFSIVDDENDFDWIRCIDNYFLNSMGYKLSAGASNDDFLFVGACGQARNIDNPDYMKLLDLVMTNKLSELIDYPLNVEERQWLTAVFTSALKRFQNQLRPIQNITGFERK